MYKWGPSEGRGRHIFMSVSDSKRHYQAGLVLFEQRRFADAAHHFEIAMRSEIERRAMRPHMRSLSFLGLSRALSDRPRPEDVAACEQAARADNFDPVLHANLGHMYLLMGKTSRALATLVQARRLDPENVRARALLARFDRRKPPVIPRLDRDHPLNRSLGRLRALLSGGRRLQSRAAR